MKQKVIILALSFLMITPVFGQPSDLTFTFISTAGDNTLRKMEQNAKAVFDEINNASRENRIPRFSTANMTSGGIDNVLALWALSRFHCIESVPAHKEIVSINIRNQYAVRNIAVHFRDLPDEKERPQDLVIEFDRNSGKISNITNALKKNGYDQIMKTGNVVTDERYRQYILEFVEELRTAYNRQDIDLIKQMFNDEALIITGTKITTLIDGKRITHTAYKTQNKEQYIKRLQDAIMPKDTNGKFVNQITVDFDKIEVIKGNDEEDKEDKTYLVRLWQKWDSKGRNNYGDEGWLTLVIDFNQKDPTIWVRVWELPGTPKSELYDLNCFYAPDTCKHSK